jgi:hypothetical protein
VRVLSLGVPLPDPVVDNYDWGYALSFYDYDAIIVNPLTVSTFIESVADEGGAHRTYHDEAIEPGGTTATSVGLADLLRQRQEETERLLARGGLVVCFAYPDVAHPRVPGFTGCHRYYWLPAPVGKTYGREYVRPGSGTDVRPTDYEHPFADFLERFRSDVLYRAVFAEGANGFGDHGKVIGRSPGGAAVAMDLNVGGGRVIFLPALPERASANQRMAAASAIVTGIRNTLLLAAEGSPPDWLDEYLLPGIAEASNRVERAEERLDSLEAELAEARNEYRSLDRYRRMLWQEGKYGLDLPVRDALQLLGWTAFSRPDEPAVFYTGKERVLIETQGSSGAVGMEVHYRLRERLETAIADTSERPYGLIVINGRRDEPPESREQQYENALRVAAESMRYCVVDTRQVFQAVQAHMAGETEKAKAFLQRLLATEGVLMPEQEEEEGASLDE